MTIYHAIAHTAFVEETFHNDKEMAENAISTFPIFGPGIIEDLETVIVTRHAALIEYLRELKLIDETAKIISHATEEDVRGKFVIGVLPLHLAVYAAMVAEIPLHIPAALRGKELSLEEIRQYAGAPAFYTVRKAIY